MAQLHAEDQHVSDEDGVETPADPWASLSDVEAMENEPDIEPAELIVLAPSLPDVAIETAEPEALVADSPVALPDDDDGGISLLPEHHTVSVDVIDENSIEAEEEDPFGDEPEAIFAPVIAPADPIATEENAEFAEAIVPPAAQIAADANIAAVEAAMHQQDLASMPSTPTGGAFTIPLLCAGIAIISCCLLIPQADANRRLAYERLKLQADLQAVEKQVETNDQFLHKVADDANLAERLAQRQMKIIREGNHVLKLKNGTDDEMSPFQLTAVAPPVALPPYQPKGGVIAKLCYNPKSRLYLLGTGLMAMAAGLVMGFNPRNRI